MVYVCHLPEYRYLPVLFHLFNNYSFKKKLIQISKIMMFFVVLACGFLYSAVFSNYNFDNFLLVPIIHLYKLGLDKLWAILQAHY